MKKITLLTTLFALTCGMLFLNSCKDDDDAEPSEFIADDNTFSSWENWTLHVTKSGVDPALGAAHAGDTSASTRAIYFKDNQGPSGGSYPVGTLISKDTKVDGNRVMITAMVKRGNGFDAGGNDWEYFVLNADGSILNDNGTVMRGANLMNGMCKGCHAKASTDYVFTK